MLHKKPLTMAVSAAVGAAFAMGMAPVNAQEEQLVEEVVVTGSRIQRANLISSSPVTQLDNEQLRLTGVTRIEDALVAIPGIQLEQSSGQAIEATGTATLELRRLGASRTLVLMNGRRLPTHSPSSTTSAADINLIPGQLVQRVEVLTGGASSTYGADAVAGVVNFIMIDDFEGIKLDYQYSQNRHDNSAGDVQRAAAALNQPFPTGTSNDGAISDVTLMLGGNFDNGRGNMTAFATYREIEGVEQGQRDHSSCPVRGRTADTLVCAGSGTNLSGSFAPVIYGADGKVDNVASASLPTYNVSGDQFNEGFGQLFNFAAPSYFQRPDERVTVGTFAHYDLNEHVEAYTELMFMDTLSTTQFGPSGTFFRTNATVNCNNPFLSAQQLDIIRDPTRDGQNLGGCNAGTPQGDDTFILPLGRRAVEGGPRTGELRHTTYRGVFGVRGDINDTWRYDASYQYSEVSMQNYNFNYVSSFNAVKALQAFENEDGDIVCVDQSEQNATCVPWNIFETGGVTPEASNFVGVRTFESGNTAQEVFMGYVQGSLGDYGVMSPFAESGVELVVGAEYREEQLSYVTSENLRNGDVGNLVNTNGRYNVKEVYFEASVPVVEDAPLMQSLVLDLGYRYSEYDFGPTTDTYKLAGSWQIYDDLKLRGSYQRAVRAPNLVDLFRPQVGSLFPMTNDPCDKANPGDAVSIEGFTFEQCARTGITEALWNGGGAVSNPASQYNDIEGGSPDLQPEEADTYTAGFIFTPGFIDGLSVSVDYYSIEIEGAIQGIQAATSLNQCLLTGESTFCSAVNRDDSGSLWFGNPATLDNSIDARSTNIGFLSTEGVDVEINYSFDVGNMGTVNIANIAGFVMKFEQQEYPGAASLRCEGVYGLGCQLPTPELKNRMQTTWVTPWNLTASLIWRYIEGTEELISGGGQGLDLDDMSYFDIAATWDVNDWAQVRFGINNLLDERPPRVVQGATDFENGNTYPGMYDPLGQYFFAGFTVQY
ncbi:TonB-dependent receptor [gamma proteobacterium NOR5-3]|nr:TonB-dependent receptor [gamma proteobacterium NOR5-3]